MMNLAHQCVNYFHKFVGVVAHPRASFSRFRCTKMAIRGKMVC
jgi:hypothetical protein